MRAFRRHHGLVVPMPADHINTDAILPKQYMKSIERTGFGAHLFDGQRYLDSGEPGIDPGSRVINPAFVLNQPRFRGASILLAGHNFGCGSSREHAPWALDQFGFRVLIARGFADIFLSNAVRNGLLPIALADDAMDQLFAAVDATPGYALTVDLETLRICSPDGVSLSCDIDSGQRERLLAGMDEIAFTLSLADEIRRFEAAQRERRPWLAGSIEGRTGD